MPDRDTRQRLIDAQARFIAALNAGGMDGIVNAAYEVFRVPIAVVDDKYRLMALRPQRDIGPSFWARMRRYGTLSLADVWELQQAYYKDRRNDYHPFYADWGPVADTPCVIAAIGEENSTYGHMALYLGRPPTEDDCAIVAALAQVLMIEFKHLREARSRPAYPAAANLQTALSAEAGAKEQTEAVRQLGRQLVGDFRLLVAPLADDAAGRAFLPCAVAELAAHYPQRVVVAYEGGVVMLFDRLDGRYFIPGEDLELRKVIAFFAGHEAFCGISAGFAELSRLPAAYRQAKLTALLARQRNLHAELAVYDDLAPQQAFLSLAASEPRDTFVPASLRQLQAYDNANNTEYLETLRCYLLSFHNRDAAAARLSIHRNTLLYRLNRINDLFGISYEDSRTSLQLLVGLLMLEAQD